MNTRHLSVREWSIMQDALRQAKRQNIEFYVKKCGYCGVEADVAARTYGAGLRGSGVKMARWRFCSPACRQAAHRKRLEQRQLQPTCLHRVKWGVAVEPTRIICVFCGLVLGKRAIVTTPDTDSRPASPVVSHAHPK